MSRFKVGDRVCVTKSVPDWLELVGLYGTILCKSDLAKYTWEVGLDNGMRLYFIECELRPLNKLEKALK
jgi:hypothetical protein